MQFGDFGSQLLLWTSETLLWKTAAPDGRGRPQGAHD